MRGTVAKRLRKKIYGLTSLRIKRRYERRRNGVIVGVGLRRAYQLEKQVYKQERRQ